MEAREVSMASKQYTEEFKAEAVKQVTERGFAVAEVAKRLGVSSHTPQGQERGLGGHTRGVDVADAQGLSRGASVEGRGETSD